jgi:hypothetical protein
VLRIKSAIATPEPTQSELAAAFDQMVFANEPPFDRTTSEDLEHRRVLEQNRQLAERQQRLEARRAPQVDDEQSEPWWRR